MKNRMSVFISVFLVLSLKAYAAKTEVRTPSSSSAFEACHMDGGEARESENYHACCSGPTHCIVCKKGVKGVCQEVIISKLNSFGFPDRAADAVDKVISPMSEVTSPGDKLKGGMAPTLPAQNIRPIRTVPTAKTKQKESSRTKD